MPTDDPQLYDSQPWQQRQQPLYVYPRPQENGSHLGPPSSVQHEHSSNVALSSFDYGPAYDQIPQRSTLAPSSAQYPPADSAQLPYTPFSSPGGYSDHRQHYLAGSQNAFGPRVPAMTNPSYPATPVLNAYTPSAFPHQLSEPGQAPDYGAHVSVPTVTTPDDVAPTYSGFDAPYYHTQTGTVRNKRQRPEEQDEDEDMTDQMQGNTLQLSTAEKLKRACARCRGLKVSLSSVLLIRPAGRA
jgi:hypothetical protein